MQVIHPIYSILYTLKLGLCDHTSQMSNFHSGIIKLQMRKNSTSLIPVKYTLVSHVPALAARPISYALIITSIFNLMLCLLFLQVLETCTSGLIIGVCTPDCMQVNNLMITKYNSYCIRKKLEIYVWVGI